VTPDRSRAETALRRIVLPAVMLVVGLVVMDSAMHALLAQGSPFGGPRAATADPQYHGIVGWLLDKQSEFYRQMSSVIRAAKTDGSAVWTLLGISFLYGICHAAGPGHGKAVISSYLVANEETARRGIALSFASALLQALVAVVIVSIAAWLLNATMQTMCNTERVIEIASYVFITALGARLIWTKGRGLLQTLRIWLAERGGWSPTLVPALAEGGSAVMLPDPGPHVHNHRDHGLQASGVSGLEPFDPQHQHGDAGHVHDEHCGHNHGPSPSELAGPGGWQRGLGAIFAVGLRPCSGAILVLVFALAQGLYWAGIAAVVVMGLGTALTVAMIAILAVSAKNLARRITLHREGLGAVALRGIEFGAAVVVLVFGAGLLLGYVAAERVTCF
jgi:nickel/cobalt exporter